MDREEDEGSLPTAVSKGNMSAKASGGGGGRLNLDRRQRAMESVKKVGECYGRHDFFFLLLFFRLTGK